MRRPGGLTGSDCWVPGRRPGCLADAAEPVAVVFACACGRDCFDEAAQAFVGVRGSVAVALVLLRCGVDDLGGDCLDRIQRRPVLGGIINEYERAT